VASADEGLERSAWCSCKVGRRVVARNSPPSEKREWDCRAEGAGTVGEFEREVNPNERSRD
jgi:hypothetical protein